MKIATATYLVIAAVAAALLSPSFAMEDSVPAAAAAPALGNDVDVSAGSATATLARNGASAATKAITNGASINNGGGHYLRTTAKAEKEGGLSAGTSGTSGDEIGEDAAARDLGQCGRQWAGCGSDTDCCDCYYCGSWFHICWPYECNS